MSAFPLIYRNPPLLLCVFLPRPLLHSEKAKPLAELDHRDPSCSQSRAASFISRQRADPGGRREAQGVGGERRAVERQGAHISQLLPPPLPTTEIK